MKVTFALLLVAIGVAMGNGQNLYGQPEYEIRKPPPPPSRTAYPYPAQRMMEASPSVRSEPIRISFSGLNESPNPNPQASDIRFGQQTQESRSGAERSATIVPILMPQSQQSQPAPQRPPPSTVATSTQQQQNRPPQPQPQPIVRPPSPPAPQKPVIPIIRFNQEIQEGVVNKFDFEAANGIKEEEETDIIHLDGGNTARYAAEEQYSSDTNYPAYNYGYDGYNKNYEEYPDNVEIVKKGKYSYYSPEGEHIEVSWIADKDGFRPIGSHIPTPVPALKHNEAPTAFSSIPPMSRRQPY